MPAFHTLHPILRDPPSGRAVGRVEGCLAPSMPLSHRPPSFVPCSCFRLFPSLPNQLPRPLQPGGPRETVTNRPSLQYCPGKRYVRGSVKTYEPLPAVRRLGERRRRRRWGSEHKGSQGNAVPACCMADARRENECWCWWRSVITHLEPIFTYISAINYIHI